MNSEHTGMLVVMLKDLQTIIIKQSRHGKTNIQRRWLENVGKAGVLCCVMGYAMHDPGFKLKGFALLETIKRNNAGQIPKVPIHKVIECFFGLSAVEQKALEQFLKEFLDGDPTPNETADVIDRWILAMQMRAIMGKDKSKKVNEV